MEVNKGPSDSTRHVRTPEIFLPEIEIRPNVVFLDEVLEIVGMTSFNFTSDERCFFQKQLSANVVGTVITFMLVWVILKAL